MQSQHTEFTMLVVEDNRFFRHALCEALQSHFLFAFVTGAATVEKAQQKIDSLKPNMVFLDISLPDGNGIELTQRLREAGNHAVISILTSHDLPEYEQSALRNGANHFFVKGRTDISEIFAAVDSVLASRFRTLIVADEAAYCEQMTTLLSRTRPGAVVACTTDWDEALDVAAVLKPDLLMLRSEAAGNLKRDFCDQVYLRCADTRMKVVLLGDTVPSERSIYSPTSTAVRRERADIASSIRSRLNGLSTFV